METPRYLKQAWGNVRNAIIGCSAAVLFGIAVLLMSIYSVAAPARVYPAGEVVTVRVQYYLPYPGMLPDSPLYKVKAARDRVMLWLTVNEEKKAKRELLYADKRIGAAAALLDGGKPDLAITTATKAEKYLESAVNRVKTLSSQGKDVKSVEMVLEKAIAKHREILESRPEFVEALRTNRQLVIQ